MPNDEKIARDGHKRHGGRLIALSKSGRQSVLDSDAFANDLAIDFPSMPDAIDLNRSADYNVTYNPVLPDGLHLYRGTKPMDIPFSFKLHAFDDDYCPEGALTLLKIAARLHAFVLPLSTSSKLRVETIKNSELPAPSINAQTGGGNSTKGQGTDDQLAADSQGNVEFKVSTGQTGSFYPPVVAWLHLMWLGKDRPGISCMGYVREVSVKLLGPYLRGPDDSFNLPSAAEYSFVFVHRPGYSNDMSTVSTVGVREIGQQVSAAADDVKDRLYTTYNLIVASSFRGFGENTQPAPALPPAHAPLVHSRAASPLPVPGDMRVFDPRAPGIIGYVPGTNIPIFGPRR